MEMMDDAATDPGALDATWTWSMADPWAIAAVAIAGGVLLLFGGRILKPAIILAVIALGAALGLDLAEGTRAGTLPSWFLAAGIPGVAWLVIAPLLAGIVAALLARFALAVLLGGSIGSVVLLIGITVTGDAKGGLETDPPPAATATTQAGPAEDSASPMGRAMVDQLASMAQSELTALGPLPDLSTVVPAGLRAWWRGATASIPPGTLDLVITIAVVAGLCGVLVCLLVPDRTSIWATSIAGGWLLSASGLAAWTHLGVGGGDPTPLLPLLGWGILVGLGVLYQSRHRGAQVRRTPQNAD